MTTPIPATQLGLSTALRPYQETGIHFLSSRKGAILADDMGLGKTRQIIEAIKKHPDSDGYILIVCPKAALSVWMMEIKKWWPERANHIVLVHGHYTHRQAALENIFGVEIVITTYDVLNAHAKVQEGKKDTWEVEGFDPHYNFLVCDEAHRIRNQRTKSYKVLKSLDANVKYFITGTPMRKSAGDLWTMLHLIKPKFFSSYWKFVRTFCECVDTDYGLEVVGLRNVAALQRLLKDYMIRRLKKDVAQDLPPKLRSLLPVELDEVQQEIYDEVEENMMAFFDGGAIITPTSLPQLTRLRQLLVCPMVLGVKSYGAGIEAIADHLDELEPNERHAVIFTPFAEVQPHLIEYLVARGYAEDTLFRLRGGLGPDVVATTIEGFKNTKGILFCTIKFAQSFSLETASVAFFLGYEYSPDENAQAEDRLHRMTSQSTVNIYYVQHVNTVDERVLSILYDKQEIISKALKDPQIFRALFETSFNPEGYEDDADDDG